MFGDRKQLLVLPFLIKKAPCSIEQGAFVVSGTPGRIRTCDPMIRSHVLYPAELLVRNEGLFITHLERLGKGILHQVM